MTTTDSTTTADRLDTMSRPAAWLPDDAERATLIGRVWDPAVEGPSPVLVRPDGVHDLSKRWPTVRDLAEAGPSAGEIRAAAGPRLGSLDRVRFLAPVDLQSLKAAGVTFVASMVERVIEERAGGDPAGARRVRDTLTGMLGDLTRIQPGSESARRLKRTLIREGMWSQYLEVGVGPDAEIFTKGQPMSAVGPGARVGVLARSRWNNPEPEVALLLTAGGDVRGVTLANDVNLRDVEGRSALLLPLAKDNNASCAIGPFIRWFDDDFTLDDLRRTVVTLQVSGDDGFTLTDSCDMSAISRNPANLVAQLIGPHHQYPDGAVLLLGTMVAPIVDRDEPGQGFTHHIGDVVTIASPRLGRLVNSVHHSETCPPWTYGVAHLMRNLAARGLLDTRRPEDT